MIKAIIFDLDDTLYDCTNTLRAAAIERALKAMIRYGLKCNFKTATAKIQGYYDKFGPKASIFNLLSEEFSLNGRFLVQKALKAYNNEDVSDIKLFPDVKKTLEELGKKCKLILVTRGNRQRQQKKIEKLGINGEFDLIVIDDISENLSKEDRFLGAIRSFNFKEEEVVVVGDRIFSEIRIGNMLGMTTIRLLHGAYSTLKPTNGLEDPDYEIKKIPEILDLFDEINTKRQLKVVAIGGGTGLPTLLEGLKKYTKDLTAIVAVTDAGRSSGMLRNDFDIAPPGDIRNCLVALSDSEKLFADLLQYRFMNGKLEGHTLGNLFITALTQVTGSFDEAIEKASKILNIKGNVFPSSSENIHINAELENGDILERESGIVNNVDKKIHKRSKIKRVFLDKENAKASEGAIKAIKEADIVIIGPGSLYTSVVTNLLVKDISKAIKNSSAIKVYVCNIMTQPTQTYGFNASDHVKVIENYLGKNVLDYIIFNNKKPKKKLLEIYKKEHSEFIDVDVSLKKIKAKQIKADLIEDIDKIEVLWSKKNLLRHDSSKIAEIIFNLK